MTLPDLDNDLERQLIEGHSWSDFCDALKRAGDQVLRAETPSDAFTRAEGFRYLTRLLRIGLDMHMESGDVEFPVFYRPSHETAKIGADNPDNVYLRAELNGEHSYRISGTRGTVHYLGFGTQSGGYGENGLNSPTGYIDDSQIDVDEKGRFAIILSAKAHKKHWLPMTLHTNTVIVRQTFLDRKKEEIAQLTIERIDGDGSQPKPLTAAQLVQRLAASAAFVEGTARLFADWSQGYQAHCNALPPADQALCQSVGGDPNIFYYHSAWRLAADEVLLIELDFLPECTTWNFQLNNYWMESLDYRYHNIHINKHSATYADNGALRIVVSHQDPGLPNWLETAGHQTGTMCFRWIGATHPQHPACRVLRISQLHSGDFK